MRVALGVLADYANVSADGKLNIMGVFQVVNVVQFPHIHAQMHLVLTLEADPSEAGAKKKIEIKLMGPDGVALFSVGGEMEVPAVNRFPGSPIGIQHILSLQGVRFTGPGDYQFSVLVGGDHRFKFREGAKHRIYIHSRYPEIRDTVSRQGSLPIGYVRDLIKHIDEVIRRDADNQS